MAETAAPAKPAAVSSDGGLLELDILGSDPASAPVASQSKPPASQGGLDLLDLNESPNLTTSTNPPPPTDSLDLLGMGMGSSEVQSPPKNITMNDTPAPAPSGGLDLLAGTSSQSTTSEVKKNALDDLDLIGNDLMTGASPTRKTPLEFIGMDDSNITLKFQCSKVSYF